LQGFDVTFSSAAQGTEWNKGTVIHKAEKGTVHWSSTFPIDGTEKHNGTEIRIPLDRNGRAQQTLCLRLKCIKHLLIGSEIIKKAQAP
jgi:hypothetical protein